MSQNQTIKESEIDAIYFNILNNIEKIKISRLNQDIKVMSYKAACEDIQNKLKNFENRMSAVIGKIDK